MEPFIRFKNQGNWTLLRRRDLPVYRSTSSETEDGDTSVRQTIRVLSALGRRDDVDQIDIDQPSRQWERGVVQWAVATRAEATGDGARPDPAASDIGVH